MSREQAVSGLRRRRRSTGALDCPGPGVVRGEPCLAAAAVKTRQPTPWVSGAEPCSERRPERDVGRRTGSPGGADLQGRVGQAAVVAVGVVASVAARTGLACACVAWDWAAVGVAGLEPGQGEEPQRASTAGAAGATATSGARHMAERRRDRLADLLLGLRLAEQSACCGGDALQLGADEPVRPQADYM